MFNIWPAPAALAKRASKAFSSSKVMFSRLRPPLGLGLSASSPYVVVGHVRPVHRAQRHAHCRGNQRLRHPALAQQHHLDALTLLGRYFPSQCCFQPPDLASGELFRTHLFIKRVYKAIFSYVHEYVVAKIAPNHSSSIDCPDSLEGTKRHHMAALRSAMVGPFLALRTRIRISIERRACSMASETGH